MNLFDILITSSRDIILTICVYYFCFFLPGVLFFKLLKHEFKGLAVYVVYPVIGMLLLGLTAYILAWVHLGILLLPILILASLFTIKKYGFSLHAIEKTHKKPLIVVLLLAFIFSLNMLLMGVFGNTIAVRSEDPVHLGYIAEMKAHFPPDNPGMAGIPLKGYHFLYQFIIASVSNALFIPVEALYFHVFPLIVSVWWAVGAYILTYEWCRKRSAALWAVFLSLFAGSWGFILFLQGHHKLSIDSVFGIGQPTVALINPQFAVSVPIILTVLILILQYFKKRSYKLLFPITLLVGMLPMIKIYGGVVLLPAFGFLIFTDLFKKRFLSILFGFISVVITLLTFGQFVGAGQGLIYAPLWPPHTVMLSNMPWYRYDEKFYTYSRLGVIKGIIEIESFGLMLYFIGNLGVRIIGVALAFVGLLYKRRLPSLFAVTLLVMILVSTFIPLFFIQTGKVFESIQFAWYYPILVSFPAALGFSYFFRISWAGKLKKSPIKTPVFVFENVIKAILIVLIIGVSLPPAFQHYRDGVFSDSFKLRKSYTNPYFVSMQYLKTHGSYNDTVLQMPPVTSGITQHELLDWFNYTSPDIAAFGNHRSYVAYEFIIFENAKPQERLGFVGHVLDLEKSAENPLITIPQERFNETARELKRKGIVYVYSPNALPALTHRGVLKEVFVNAEAYIYKVI